MCAPSKVRTCARAMQWCAETETLPLPLPRRAAASHGVPNQYQGARQAAAPTASAAKVSPALGSKMALVATKTREAAVRR